MGWIIKKVAKHCPEPPSLGSPYRPVYDAGSLWECDNCGKRFVVTPIITEFDGTIYDWMEQK